MPFATIAFRTDRRTIANGCASTSKIVKRCEMRTKEKGAEYGPLGVA
jgi:hypothetical protein